MERGKGSTEKCDHTALAVLKQSLMPHNSNPIEQNVNNVLVFTILLYYAYLLNIKTSCVNSSEAILYYHN